MRVHNKFFSIILSFFFLSIIACKKDDDSTTNGSSSENNQTSALIIENGSQTIKLGESITYSAKIVNGSGEVSNATEVQWSTSDNSKATISGSGVITSNSSGGITVVAEATVDGNKLTASAPLSILSTSPAFAVVPSAVAWSTQGGDIPLTTVYFGAENASYTYSSSDESVVKVSNSGVLSFVGGGTCVITVTSSINGNPSVQVPVFVVGTLASLKVARIEIFNSSNEKVLSHDMFRNQTEQFSAKAYDQSGNEVNTEFTWQIDDNSLASVDQNGKLNSGGNVGRTMLKATSMGVKGEAEIFIYPDSVIVVNPVFKLNVTAGSSHSLSADLYKFDPATLSLNPTPIQSPASGVEWQVLPTKIDLFNPGAPVPPASVNNGIVNINNDVTIGDVVIVVASLPGTKAEPGVSTLTVGF